MSIEVKKCLTKNGIVIEGLYEIQPKVFKDDRGYFLETYSARDFEAAGLDTNFVQDNESFSSKGVLRGLHYQKKYPQGKLVRAVQGRVFDVAVDIRKGSSTYGEWYSVFLRSDLYNQFYIPKGFAHGFLVLSDTALFSYKCTEFYHGDDEGGIIFNDSAIGIDWPAIEGDFKDDFKIDANYIMSEKDKKWPRL
ncbi:MAG: dTDP-4-dehydrorhamnose 3,5-epimerase [Termitinemataceae bacterium]|nr:MAG: dTDP-4-dehydrorhamnose 3,5-epimerase [Termitinemataceae bacterium]